MSFDVIVLRPEADFKRVDALTPHIAGVTRQSAAFLFRSSWANLVRVMEKGEPPLNRVY